MQSRSPVRMSSGPPSVNLTASVSPGNLAEVQILRSPSDLLTQKHWVWGSTVSPSAGLCPSSDACCSLGKTAVEKQRFFCSPDLTSLSVVTE